MWLQLLGGNFSDANELVIATESVSAVSVAVKE
jgi:hypothetical protein